LICDSKEGTSFLGGGVEAQEIIKDKMKQQPIEKAALSIFPNIPLPLL
jgi:hypothetical protein